MPRLLPVWSDSITLANLSGHPYLHRICYRPALPTVSKALVKSTKTTQRDLFCSKSMHFSCSCLWQKIMSTMLRFLRNPHCVSGTVLGVEEDSSNYTILLASL